MKRTIITLIILTWLSMIGKAQSGGKIKFDTINYDFGTIAEGTQATFSFNFTNVGDLPLILTSVRASSGSVTPKWSRDPIGVGGKGSIIVIYDSKSRPGNFTKTITVKDNGLSATTYLTIRGFVSSVDPPLMAFEKKWHSFDTLIEGAKDSAIYKFQNTGQLPLEIYSVTATHSSVKAQISSSTINAKEWGEVKLIFDSKGLNGIINEGVIIKSNSPEEVSIGISTYVKEDTSGTLSVRSRLNNSAPFIYPNPVQDRVYIARLFELGNINIQLTDIQGKEMLRTTINQKGPTQYIDLSSLPQGLYLMRVIGDGVEHSERIIKQ